MAERLTVDEEAVGSKPIWHPWEYKTGLHDLQAGFEFIRFQTFTSGFIAG
jgi:hypothetical protein